MSDFTPYEPIVPAMISKIYITVVSEMVEDVDEYNEPLGTYTETESLEAFASVVDSDNVIIETHITSNPQVLINNNILTTQQLLTIQDWIRSVRDNAELALLPPAG